MAYINSENVMVFPSPDRSQVLGNNNIPNYGQYFTNYNMVNIINRLVNKSAFVISTDLNNPIFEFNIYGFYFAIPTDTVKSLLTSEGYLNASINLNTVNGSPYILKITPAEGSLIDGNNQYTGLNLNTDNSLVKANSPSDVLISLAQTGSATVNLSILFKSDSTYTIPSENQVIMGSTQVHLDDGEL